MNFTPKINHALIRAAVLHREQTRKDADVPYIVHPVGVAMILDKYTDDEDVICAGFLHDVLEDVAGYSRANLAQEFGERVAQIVQEVSEDKDPNMPEDAKATWRERKEKYLADLRQDSEEALLEKMEKMGHVPISLEPEGMMEQVGAV